MKHQLFAKRHIGIHSEELNSMLRSIRTDSLESLIEETVPKDIRIQNFQGIPDPVSEFEFLEDLKSIAKKNKLYSTYIGQGYFGTITPSVILRNIFQNPGWYTQYTPYQAEIAQGRLEALLNFQTMVSDLTGLPIANASLLDEGTAAAEAMSMFFDLKNKKSKNSNANVFLVDQNVYPQTLAVLKTRATPLGIEVQVVDCKNAPLDNKVFGILLQYPGSDGKIEDFKPLVEKATSKEIYTTVASDLMALTLLQPPGEWGADAVVGNSQRFGVPLGFGGPHAAFFATKDEFKRQIPGRIIGVSVDSAGQYALRMALQTREQHIRREKATSNICTAQALLAIMASMYAVWHGSEGLKAIALEIHRKTSTLYSRLNAIGLTPQFSEFFDTLSLAIPFEKLKELKCLAEKSEINFHYLTDAVQISIDETTLDKNLENIIKVFETFTSTSGKTDSTKTSSHIPDRLKRNSAFLTHEVFNSHHTETKMMRYIKSLENKDLSLTHSMIALGSCTMKLNAATELIPVSWPEFANLHPFVPLNQTEGYQEIFHSLEKWLSEITGFSACSLQPNSGAQGEYAGLLTIRNYHLSRGDNHRNIVLIPSSAHGTNPASAVMAGMEVVVVNCNEKGDIDIADLKAKGEEHKSNLAALMVTYPSTHGVFETAIKEICDFIHELGGKVYMDGANMNAQVGLTSPGAIHADVCHLNLHKTFAIPHGGGGPGMGPICVNESLAPFLPGHPSENHPSNNEPVSAAPYGSASILLISYAYIKLLGKNGLKDATIYAILNSNYIKSRLENHYSILYTGENGRTAHELIIDLRPFKAVASAEDVAKRLIDYGFHAPTLSFPVAGTIMIEPTESESKEELDLFCDALISIRKEIDEIASGEFPADNNVLCNAPHTIDQITMDDWNLPYTREKAAFPLPYLKKTHKFWVKTGRINNAHGDRNLICTCLPMEAYLK
ncbi:MAG: aminomethyl-transferring glycine dehydrogenase [Bacteroidota bacterium]